MNTVSKSANESGSITKNIISSLIPTGLIGKLSKRSQKPITISPNNERPLITQTQFDEITSKEAKDILTTVNKILKETDNENPYPIVVVAGDTTNYNDKLPYNVCETHKTESGISITKYEPRAWEFNQDNSITLFDGTNGASKKDEGEVEFEVSIESEDIIGMWAQNPK